MTEIGIILRGLPWSIAMDRDNIKVVHTNYCSVLKSTSI